MSVVGFGAMGTKVEVHASSASAHQAVRHRIESFEQAFSRFRDDSELSRINAATGSGVSVSPDMRGILEAAAIMKRRTNGLFDVGVGEAMSDWGYDRSFEDIVEGRRAPASSSPPQWRIDDGVVSLGPGTRLDLGGIAKGWAADRIVEAGIADVVSVGGDLRSTDETLVVDVLDHFDEVAAEVEVGVGALATSSRMKRTWLVDGARVHHLIDPRTMRPADTPTLSATVVADTAVEAEVAAKVILLMGADGLWWADRQDWIRYALVVWSDASVFSTAARVAS